MCPKHGPYDEFCDGCAADRRQGDRRLPPAAQAQPAPVGNGTVVLTEVVARLEDWIKIREQQGLGAPNTEGALRRLIDDLEVRAEFGKTKYGTYLRTNNGRDAAMDLYQESLDAVMYSAQGLLEGDRHAASFFNTAVTLAEQVAAYLEERDGKVEKRNTGDGN